MSHQSTPRLILAMQPEEGGRAQPLPPAAAASHDVMGGGAGEAAGAGRGDRVRRTEERPCATLASRARLVT
eukprot:985916-Pyramimonas_sp.AAC.1